MNMKQKYEEYKKEHEQYQKEVYAYELKLNEMKEKIYKHIESFDIIKLASMGIEFDFEVERVSDVEYCKSKLEELRMIYNHLEQKGLQLLKS